MKRKSAAFFSLLFFFCVAIVGPWIAPFKPNQQFLLRTYDPPSATHLLGNADNGIDILSQLLWGTRTTAILVVATISLSVLIGSVVGLVAGLNLKKPTDRLILIILDAFQALPSLPLYLVFLALLENPTLFHLILALSFNRWVLFARIARSQTAQVSSLPFVDAARTIGLQETTIAFRHILPHISVPILVQATTACAGVILSESALAFLGIAPAEYVSWGLLLRDGASSLLVAPHVSIFAGLPISASILMFSSLGDQYADQRREVGISLDKKRTPIP